MAWATSNRRQQLPANWQELRRLVLERDRGICQIRDPGCVVRATDVDHVIPNGDDSPANLRAACRRCHARKSSREGGAASAANRARARRVPEPHPGVGGG